MAGGQPHRGNSSSVLSSNSISRTELKDLKLHHHLHLNGDESSEESNPVLQKLKKWADYPSYNTWVEATRFLPMKTPMSMEIIESWSLPEAPKHVLTISGLLEEQRRLGRTIGLIIDLSNHDTLYAEDLAEHPEVEYAHIQLVAKAFPGRGSITQVIKTARSYWRQHPDKYIAIHCAYGFNRTGFVVCAYLIQECGMSVQQALAAFAAARPPGVKHEKFVVELHRRYGHKLAPIPPTPDPELADGASDAHGSEGAGASVLGRSPEEGGDGSLAGRSPPDGGGGGSGSSVAGRSPQTDPGSSMTGASGASPPNERARTAPKVIRLYPDSAEDPAQPWEPGTPTRETSAATAQVWEALQRGGQAAAYRMRTASELSVAGSAGGRWSEEGGAPGGHHSSGDGRFSCSSLYSEFGAVAAHLEEHYPGLALARKSMRPLPPRSTTSEADGAEQQLGAGARRFSGGSMGGSLHGPAAEDQGAAEGTPCEPGQASVPPSPVGGLAHPGRGGRSPAQGVYMGDDAREGGGAHAGEARALQPGLLSTALAQGSRRAEANGHPPSGGPGGDDAASPSRSANGAAGDAEPWHACLDNHSYSRGGSREHSLSLQKSSISASSLRTESAHSLVNNESLGLDERAVFESFNKAGLHARRKAKKKAEVEAEAESGRMSLQELRGGCADAQPDLASHQLDESQFHLDTGSPATGDRLAPGSLAAEQGARPDTPFAAAAAQVPVETPRSDTTSGESERPGGEKNLREAVGEGVRAGFGQPRRKSSAHQTGDRHSQRCRFM